MRVIASLIKYRKRDLVADKNCQWISYFEIQFTLHAQVQKVLHMFVMNTPACMWIQVGQYMHDTNLCTSALCVHFRLAVLRRWRSKYGLAATYRNLAECFYSAGRLEIVEVVCQALRSPYVIKGAVPPSESVYNMELYAILTDYSVI